MINNLAQYELTCKSSAIEIQDIEPQWRALVGLECANNPFLLPYWYSSWFNHSPESKNGQVYTVKKSGEIVAIIPVQKKVIRSLGKPFIIYKSLLHEIADYNDVIIKKDNAEAFIYWINVLTKDKCWDIIYFKDVPCSATLLSAVDLNKDAFPYRVIVQKGNICPYIEVKQSWDNYLKAMTSRNRSNTIKVLKKLVELPDITILDERSWGSDLLNTNTLHDIETRSWKSESAILNFPWKRKFFQQILNECARDGNLALYAVAQKNKLIAYSLSFRCNNKIMNYGTAYDMDYVKLYAGLHTEMTSVKKGFEEKIIEFDFLRGDENFKQDLTSTARRNHDIFIFRNSAIAIAFQQYCKFRKRIKDLIRRKKKADWKGTIQESVFV